MLKNFWSPTYEGIARYLRVIRTAQSDCHQNVHKAIENCADTSLFLSIITIGEITKGIELLIDGQRKRELQHWLQTLEQHYADRILPVDLDIIHIWGEITASTQKSGQIIAASDGLITATALRHGLHIMTRNFSDFKLSGGLLINPWA